MTIAARRPARGIVRRPITPGAELCAYRRAYPGLSWRQLGLLFELTAEQAQDVWRCEGGGVWWHTGAHGRVRRAA